MPARAAQVRIPVMHLSPDELIYWQFGFIKINATIVFTWLIMLLLSLGSLLITKNLSRGFKRSRWQNALEIVVTGLNQQINEVGLRHAQKYLPFIGTLFLFLVTASISTVVPEFEPPSASLSTTTALALCVFIAVPMFGIAEQGVSNYLKIYMAPTVIMLPFNIIS